MPASFNRNAIRPARGTKAALLANTSELKLWELVHATDEDALYVWNGSDLVKVGFSIDELETKADLDANGHVVFNQLPPIKLGDLADVVDTAKVNGSVLMYNAAQNKFVANNLETKTTLTDGGNW